MKLWLDAQISPTIASWIREEFSIEATAARELGLLVATDRDIFEAARATGAIVMTKDSDFVALQERLGPPPQIVWLTCGNTSNARLRALLSECWPRAQELLEAGERLVEIGDRTGRLS